MVLHVAGSVCLCHLTSGILSFIVVDVGLVNVAIVHRHCLRCRAFSHFHSHYK